MCHPTPKCVTERSKCVAERPNKYYPDTKMIFIVPETRYLLLKMFTLKHYWECVKSRPNINCHDPIIMVYTIQWRKFFGKCQKSVTNSSSENSLSSAKNVLWLKVRRLAHVLWLKKTGTCLSKPSDISNSCHW